MIRRRWGVFLFTSSRGGETERKSGREEEREESKCNLLCSVKRARLHPFLMPELWTTQCVSEVSQSSGAIDRRSGQRTQGWKTRTESRGIKEERESKPHREGLPGRNSQTAEGRKVNTRAAGTTFYPFSRSSRTNPSYTQTRTTILLCNQSFDFEASWKLGDRVSLCMIHSQGGVSQRIWPWWAGDGATPTGTLMDWGRRLTWGGRKRRARLRPGAAMWTSGTRTRPA